MNQLKRLPADPSRLAALLRVGLPAGSGPQIEALLFASAADLLNLPVSPQVRTAAFKVMAGVNGARLLGTITDPAESATGHRYPDGDVVCDRLDRQARSAALSSLLVSR